MNGMLAALQFLTVVPVSRSFDDEDVARSMLFFPLVGLIIGLFLIVVSSLSDTPMIAAVLIVIAWVLVTGGLHLDGLADSADAWAAGRGNPERALEVMKDPRCGPFAVTTLTLILIAKFAAITVLLENNALVALLIAPVLGRTAVLALYNTTRYVRENGLGTLYAEYLDKNMILLIAGISALLSMFILGFWPVVLAIVVLATLRWLMVNQIGGMTGDTIGAAIEIIEVSVLFAAASVV